MNKNKRKRGHEIKYDNVQVQNILLIDLCVDGSLSMRGQVINGLTKNKLLNEALAKLLFELGKDALLNTSVEVCITCFNDTVEVIRAFATVQDKPTVDLVPAKGQTKIGEGIIAAVEELRKRVAYHKEVGESHVLTPVLLIMSDGEPCASDPQALKKASELCRNSSGEFVTIPIAIGSDGEYLSTLAASVLKIEDIEIKALFEGVLCATRNSISVAASEAYAAAIKQAMTWTEILKK